MHSVSAATLLDFANSTATSSLTVGATDASGGEIRWANIATVDGNSVDLVAVVTGGTYDGNTSRNGLGGAFGRIHISPATAVEFTFTIVASGGSSPVVADSWDFAYFDIDKNAQDTAIESLAVTSATGLVSYEVTQSTTLNVSNNPLAVVATATGNNGDNPTLPTSLTAAQQHRTILFTLEDTSSFVITLESQGAGGSNSGRSYLFAGEATFTELTTVVAVPEPTSAGLLGVGFVGLLLRRKRK